MSLIWSPRTTKRTRVTRTMAVAVVAWAASGCSGRSYVPPALGAPAGTFSRAVAQFGTDTKSSELPDYRRSARRDFFVATVRDFVQTDNADDKTLRALTNPPTPQNFLCRPRYGYQRVAVRIGNLEAVGTAVGEKLQAPSNDLAKLVKALSQSYTIRLEPAATPSTYDEWLTRNEGKQCADVVASGDPFATRTWVGTEFAPAGDSAA